MEGITSILSESGYVIDRFGPKELKATFPSMSGCPMEQVKILNLVSGWSNDFAIDVTMVGYRQFRIDIRK